METRGKKGTSSGDQELSTDLAEILKAIQQQKSEIQADIQIAAQEQKEAIQHQKEELKFEGLTQFKEQTKREIADLIPQLELRWQQHETALDISTNEKLVRIEAHFERKQDETRGILEHHKAESLIKIRDRSTFRKETR
ncbi:hypothetical protein QE152_g27398 [Popillia japonica]|uniref:Uncharacterized protein n=1 Tax=Popillia japonica TaxID=7064 RepID=A0AAW1JVI3_POPJA